MCRGGAVRISGSGAILTSGAPVRIYGVTIYSGNVGSELILRDGTGGTADAHWQERGSANEGKYFSLGSSGKLFPNGCFASVDANISYATLDCELVRRT